MTATPQDSQDIYRAPEADLLGPSSSIGGQTDENENVVGAGFWIRGLAQFIDTGLSLVLGFVMGTVAFTLAIVLGIIASPEDWEPMLERTDALGYLTGFLATIAYHTASEYYGGASLGKMMCGLLVVDQGLKPVSFRGALIRSLAFFVDGMFFGAVAYSAMKGSVRQQRYGDQWGRTMVVFRRQAPQRLRRNTPRMLVGVLLGSVLWFVFASSDIVLAMFMS